MPKYAVLHYDHPSMNLGDNVQTIATEQFLPRIDDRFDRDSLGKVETDEEHVLIMNGWFTTRPENWPPSRSVIPVFFGFHICTDKQARKQLLSEKSIEYFKRHEPVGCRDRATARLLDEKGIETFYSKCLTLTFPKREQEPENGKIFLVDVDPKRIPVPEHIEKEAEIVTHMTQHFYPDSIKTDTAGFLLDLYRKEARLVITDKLHCALPCVAFGIPVIFFGDPDEGRVSILNDLSVPIYKKPTAFQERLYRKLRKRRMKNKDNAILGPVYNLLYDIGYNYLRNKDVDWNPVAKDIEHEKTEIRNKIKKMLGGKATSLGNVRSVSLCRSE